MAEERLDIEQYIEQLADKTTRAQAMAALREKGTNALDAIRDGLSHPDWHVRQWCAVFLDHIWDAQSLQRLLLTLHDPKRKVRLWAVHSLGCDKCKGGENPLDVVPHLAERIAEDKSIRVRRMAAWTLAMQQPERRIARILRRVLRDETDAKMRMAANWGLQRREQPIPSELSPADL